MNLMDFKVTEHIKFIDIIWIFTFQCTFKKRSLVEFWCSIKEYSELSEKAIKMLLSFPAMNLCEAVISWDTSIDTTFSNILKVKVYEIQFLSIVRCNKRFAKM